MRCSLLAFLHDADDYAQSFDGVATKIWINSFDLSPTLEGLNKGLPKRAWEVYCKSKTVGSRATWFRHNAGCSSVGVRSHQKLFNELLRRPLVLKQPLEHMKPASSETNDIMLEWRTYKARKRPFDQNMLSFESFIFVKQRDTLQPYSLEGGLE